MEEGARIFSGVMIEVAGRLRFAERIDEKDERERDRRAGRVTLTDEHRDRTETRTWGSGFFNNSSVYYSINTEDVEAFLLLNPRVKNNDINIYRI